MQEIDKIYLHFIWSIQIKVIFLHPQTKGNALLAQLVEQLTLNQWSRVRIPEGVLSRKLHGKFDNL